MRGINTQLDFFLFTEPKQKYMNAYHHFVQTKEVVELVFLKLLFFGPPRFGKTVACRRLIGEIINLISAGEAELIQPSTNAVECGHDMIVTNSSTSAAAITESDWCPVKNIIDEACMLFHNFSDSVEAQKKVIALPAAFKVGPTMKTKPTAGPSSLPSSKYIKIDSSLRTNTDGSLSSTVNLSRQPSDIPVLKEIFEKATQQPKFWKDVKSLFRAFLRIEDTGGQPELMDMLPALSIGPGLYMLFFSYESQLDCEFEVFFQEKLGKCSKKEQSAISLKEMLLSTLSSISCSSVSANAIRSEEFNNSDLEDILESSKSVAYIVGTHKDKVSEECISKYDEDLINTIKGTDFYKEGVVQFFSANKLVVSMDNMGGGIEEINEIRKMLERTMENHFKKVKIPGAWLLFSLCLRTKNSKIASIEDCVEMSRLFNMTTDETKVALWFLHHHAGVLMYFPNIPVLQDLVILDVQVVYDSVSHLILQAMSFDSVGRASAEKFRETGHFVLKDLIAATSHVSGDIIPPIKLVALLQFLHIIAPIIKCHDLSSLIGNETEITYLMPCILCCANKNELDAVFSNQSRPQCAAPLMVQYKCGFVPLGIFPALIASLIAHKSFEVVEDGIKKNMVQFYYGPRLILITFLCYSQFYAVVISELPIVEHDIHEECVAIRKVVETTLGHVSSHMNYNCFLDYQFAFECPQHPGREHLCVVDNKDKKPKLMKCYHNLRKMKPVKMEDIHTVWFYKVR